MNKEEIINILIEELGLTNYIKVADYLINLESNIIILQQQNKKYKELIDKVIKLIEYSYYSKNTTDIDSIVVLGNELLQVRKILKEVE